MSAIAPISVVIPLYNAAAHIGAALASVRAQEPGPAEIIVIDDGSTDSGAAIVSAIDDTRIMLLRQPNRGVAAARNAGLSAATQALVAFLDADDLWCPGHLGHLAAMATQFPDVAVLGTGFRAVPADVAPGDIPSTPAAEPARRADYVAEAAEGRAPFYTSSCMVRRDVARAEGGFPEGHSHGEDMALWITLSERHGAAARAALGALYRRSPGGLTSRAVAVPDIAMRTLDALMPDAPPQRRAVMQLLRTRLALAHALDALSRGDGVSARAALAEAGDGFPARRCVARALSLLPAPITRAAFALRAALAGAR